MPKSSDNTSLSLPPKSSLANLRKQAKSLLKAARANDESARRKFHTFHPTATQPANLTLSDAQLVIARSYGFTSWPKLKAHVTIESYSALPGELRNAENSDKLIDRFISLACLNYTNDHRRRREEARKQLAAYAEMVADCQSPHFSREVSRLEGLLEI